MKCRHRFLRAAPIIACWAAVEAVFACGIARADEAGDTAAARLLGWDGVTLADSGNCAAAIEKLLRAEKLHHAPTTSARLGECEVELGKLVAGTERLQRLVREPVQPGAPQAFIDAMARANGVLDRALGRVAVLRISVRAPGSVRFVVRVDGEPLPEALIDNDRPTDPGRHRVQVVSQGFFASAKEISLNDGETKSVLLELDRDFNAPLPSAAPSRAPATPKAVESDGTPNHAVSLVAFGVGALGLGTGIVAGLAVAGKASDLSRSCDARNVCPPIKESEIGSARTWATIATTGFIVAGAAVGAGLVLLVAGKSESHATPSRTALEPVVGPTYLGVRGGF